jgi:sugar phosphate isomerase/epimerase
MLRPIENNGKLLSFETKIRIDKIKGEKLLKLSFELWPNNPYGIGARIGGIVRNSWGDELERGEFDRIIEKLANLGYKGIDIVYPIILALPEKNRKKVIKKLKSALYSNAMEIPSIAAHISFVNPREWERRASFKYLKSAIDTAAEIGAKTVVTYSGAWYNPPVYITMPYKKAWEMLVEGFKECAKYAEEKGVELSCEILNNHIINSLDSALKLLEDVGSEAMFITIDTAHTTIALKPFNSVPDIIKALRDRINHVHLKDALGFRGGEMWFCWWGAGQVNFEEFAKALKEINYDRYSSVEWEGWFINKEPGGAGPWDFDFVAAESKAFLESKGWG